MKRSPALHHPLIRRVLVRLLPVAALLALAGCVVAPEGGYYAPGYYAPGAVVTAPIYVGPGWGWGHGGYGGGGGYRSRGWGGR